MRNFEIAHGDIYRLKVPFERIYTSVFLIEVPGGPFLVDCATTDADVDTCILPALQGLGYALTDIKKLVLTHTHSDHAGGLARILEHAPRIEVVTDACRLSDGVCTYPLPGHTADFLGVFDARSRTLISGDGLQGAGVDKYRCSVPYVRAYLESLEKIKKDKGIENLLFSHAYEPWLKDHVLGRRAVEECLRECKKYVKEA